MSVDTVPVPPNSVLESAGAADSVPTPEVAPELVAPDLDAFASGSRLQVFAPPVLALGAFVLVCLTLTFLSVAAPILNPIMLGGFMAVLALPAHRWLNRRKIKKGLVLLILMLDMLLIGLGIALLLWLSVTRLQDGLATYAAQLTAQIQAWAAQLEALGLQVGVQTTRSTAAAANGALMTIVAAVASAAGQFLVAAVLAAFLLLEAPRLKALLQTSMRDLPFIGMTPQVVDAAVQYFLIRIRLNILTGAAFGLVLWLLGVDYALLWAVMTALLSFVPYIGLTLAAIPATLLALAEFGAGRALLVVVAVVVINTVIENVVAPSYTGKMLNLSPVVVFVSFLFWVWLLGPLGALLAMPITVLLMLTFGHYKETRWLAQIIAGSALPPV